MSFLSELFKKKQNDEKDELASSENDTLGLSNESDKRVVIDDDCQDHTMRSPVTDVEAHSSRQRIDTLGNRVVDELFADSGFLVIDRDKASIGIIQRHFKIGFNRAARIMDQLQDAGVVGPEEGTAPRKVLMGSEQFDKLLESGIRVNESVSPGLTEEASGRSVYEAAKDTEEKIALKFPERQVMFSPNNVKALIKAGNCIIDKCSYDDPLDFCEVVLSRCSPTDVRLVLIDTGIKMMKLFNGFPALLIPAVDTDEKVVGILDWLRMEITKRQEMQIAYGLRQYTDYYSSSVSNERPLPIVVIIRDFADIQDNYPAMESLRKILPFCDRFGVFFIAFTQYKYSDIRLGESKDFLSQKSADWMLSIFNDVPMEETTDRDYQFDEMNGIAFEQFCAKLLEQNGFVNVKLTSQSNDYGGDILAEKDQVKFVFQCKRYEGSVGISAVQEVMGSMSRYSCHVGVVFTNSSFTKQAVNLAQANNILLWDRDKLISMVDGIYRN